MKLPIGLWLVLTVIAFLTGGLGGALLIGALSAASSIATGFHVQDQHSVGGGRYKSLR